MVSDMEIVTDMLTEGFWKGMELGLFLGFMVWLLPYSASRIGHFFQSITR